MAYNVFPNLRKLSSSLLKLKAEKKNLGSREQSLRVMQNKYNFPTQCFLKL